MYRLGMEPTPEELEIRRRQTRYHCAACGARQWDVTLWSQIVAIAADVVCCMPPSFEQARARLQRVTVRTTT